MDKEKEIIKIAPKFVKRFTFGFAAGITLWPFGIFFTDEIYKDLYAVHEGIHWRQQKEMLGIFFYLWYAVEYLIRFVAYGFKHELAYKNISFEQEAYVNEGNPNYLEQRYPFEWIHYLDKKTQV